MVGNSKVTMHSIGAAAFLLLAACSSPGPAPVQDRTHAGGKPAGAVQTVSPRPLAPQIVASTSGLHTVQRGETLYAIAFANSLDYREVAVWNQLESADRILVGQVLRLTPPPGAVEIRPLDTVKPPAARPLDEPTVLREPKAIWLPYTEANWARVNAPPAVAVIAPAPSPAPTVPAPPPILPAVAPSATTPPPPALAANGTVDAWMWPADGTLAGHYGAAGGKGIDIFGTRNTPIKAVAPGKVVYSGNGLRGYGHLIIVKHAGEFLSAYAHNETILVKEGDMVTAGQNIALMGDSDAERVKLHFEIRRYGKPLDPLNYLPERS